MPERFEIAIAGGSIGGLCAGLVLQSGGHQVTIYERTSGPMTSRGAGIVVQPELQLLIREHVRQPLPTTRCSSRRYLSPNGADGRDMPMAQKFTSWEAIHRTLRAGIQDARYHGGSAVERFETTGARVDLQVAGRPSSADILVSADGWRSSSREQLLPDVRTHYAGYVAWRGTLDEADADPELLAFFDDRFTFSDAKGGGHALCYLIPGEGGDAGPGRRRLNWVWYIHVAEGPALQALLTTRSGELRTGSVSPGDLRPELVEALRESAALRLHPRFADLIAATPDPFLQSILDLEVPQMAFGRACLLGDAAFIVRPHTAGATAKAAADALMLGEALHRHTQAPEALRAYEARRLAAGRSMAEYGRALGRRFGAET